ncbi:carbohydrate porin [Bdellovibrio sp. HCB337]|uniref:carbohydrate porin n=1 Tax=Bdellovibrio sp. HCB337 TaxID=3394358 RepID=UPI0039A72B5F
MKRVVALLWILIGTSASSFALEGDFTGYLRGGTGLNLQGGQEECFNNEGIPGNFLRLGNECGFYSELAIVFSNKKADENDGAYFRTQMRITTDSRGTRQWERAADRDMSQIEAFVTAGGFSEVAGDFWIGKRFYRDVDLYIFDWYYFADMSGVGAGVENIPLGSGKFSLAHLIQANDTVSSSVGKPVLQAIDLRWKTLPVRDQLLYLWGVYAWAPRSTEGVNEYVKTDGYSLSARVSGPLATGNNNLSLMYGKGTMKDFNIYANSALPETNDSQNRAWTIRVVEDWQKEVSARWAVLFALAGEIGDNGTDTLKHREWQAIGIRPIYFVSDRFQWVFETGYSRYKNDAEVDGLGNPIGARELGRVSLAPQLSLSKSIWVRPVMRAFVAYSFWTDSNKTYVDNKAPSFADKNAGMSFGYQFEAWF